MRITRLMSNEMWRRPFSMVLIFCLSLLCTAGLSMALVVACNAAQWSSSLLGLGSNTLQLTVLPPLAQQSMGIGLSKPRLSDADVLALRADTRIAAVHIIHAIPIPATLHIYVPGIADNQQLVSLVGLEPTLFTDPATVTDSAHDTHAVIRAHWHIEDDRLHTLRPIPVVINDAIIRFYNLGMADRYNLPHIDKQLIIGMTFDMIWGADMFQKNDGYFRGKITVVGFSNAVSPWDIGIPEAYARQLRAHFLPPLTATLTATETNTEADSRHIMKLHVLAHAANDLQGISTHIHQRHLRIANDNPLSAMIHHIHHASIYIMTGLIAIVGAIVLLSLYSIISMICSERKRQIYLYRQLGASFIQLSVIFFGGITSALCSGVLCACVLVRLYAATLLTPLLTQLHITQSHLAPLVHIPAYLELSGLAIALMLSAIASITIWRLHRVDMLKLLRA